MHESEAMDFITSVLRGFMERIFKLSFEENEEICYSMMEKIHNYIQDRNGHWVKVKAEDVINYFEDLETNIVNGSFKPESLEMCIELVLHFAEKNMQERIDVYITEKNKRPKMIHDYFPLPLLPKH